MGAEAWRRGHALRAALHQSTRARHAVRLLDDACARRRGRRGAAPVVGLCSGGKGGHAQASANVQAAKEGARARGGRALGVGGLKALQCGSGRSADWHAGGAEPSFAGSCAVCTTATGGPAFDSTAGAYSHAQAALVCVWPELSSSCWRWLLGWGLQVQSPSSAATRCAKA